MSDAVAVIPARGGSQRIPRKNIREFRGKPIISYPIEAAFASGIFKEVIVSSDCPEIGSVAAKSGAKWSQERPEELSGHDVSLLDVMKYEASQLSSDIEFICFILATSPLISVENIRKGYETITENDWDYVIAAAEFPSPIQRSFERTEAGGTKMVFEDMYQRHSNEMKPAFHDAGQFYWGTREKWVEPTPGFFGPKTTILEISRFEAQDIDTESDWKAAEQLFDFLKWRSGE